jgi:hypothetical protein
LAGSVVSAVVLVEMQEKAEEEEGPVQRQTLLVLMMEVLEGGKKMRMVAMSMQEVGYADADNQTRKVEVADDLMLMGRRPQNPDTVGRCGFCGGAGSDFAVSQDSISWGLPAVRDKTQTSAKISSIDEELPSSGWALNVMTDSSLGLSVPDACLPP